MPRLLTLLLALLLALPAAAQTPSATALSERDQADIKRAEEWLQETRTLHARFTQVAPDGGFSSGKVWWRRPGRLRFEYDAPVPVLVVADGTFVIFHDKELGQIDRVPLGSTPLSVLVAENPKLGGRIGVKSVERQPGTLRLVLFDRDAPKEGEITLVFSEAPFDLRQWRVTDARGQATQITLSDKEVNRELPASLFVFIDPVPGRPTR